MNTRSKFDEDFDVAYASITDVMDRLMRKMPNEMVAYVLLRKFNQVLEGITDFDQWELLKGEIVDLRDDFGIDVERHLSNLIDPDLEAENYDRRHAQV